MALSENAIIYYRQPYLNQKMREFCEFGITASRGWLVCAGWGSAMGWRNKLRRVPTTIFKL